MAPVWQLQRYDNLMYATIFTFKTLRCLRFDILMIQAKAEDEWVISEIADVWYVQQQMRPQNKPLPCVSECCEGDMHYTWLELTFKGL